MWIQMNEHYCKCFFDKYLKRIWIASGNVSQSFHKSSSNEHFFKTLSSADEKTSEYTNNAGYLTVETTKSKSFKNLHCRKEKYKRGVRKYSGNIETFKR